MSEEKFDVFISYKRINIHIAEMIRMKLESQGIRCYMDKSILHMGDTWEQEIIKNIKKSPNFICIITKEAIENILYRIRNEKRDFFLEEIRTALNCHKPKKQILIFLCNGYQFPNIEEFDSDTPDEIKQLSKLHALALLNEDIDGCIDRLISDMKKLQKAYSYHSNTVDFIDDMISSKVPIKEVGLIFHAGADWFRETRKREQLDLLILKGARLKVLLNTEEAAMILARHMENPKILYSPFEESIAEWLKFEKSCPEQIEVRISDIPLMRRTYFFTDQNDNGVMRVSQYTYQEFDIEQNPVQIISTQENPHDFENYKKEFLYLWEKAHSS